VRRTAHLTLILNIATAKTVRTFLIAKTIAITASSFFLTSVTSVTESVAELPSAIKSKIENRKFCHRSKNPHRGPHPHFDRDAQVQKEAYRYSRPTTRRRTGSGKILATCGG
jgi:hypothetical protein